MGFFDFLSGGGTTAVQPYNPAASPDANQGVWNAGVANTQQQSGQGFDFNALLSNPNFIQALGTAGSNISQGQPIGQAIGSAATNYARNTALQKATAKQTGMQDDKMKMLMEALGQSGVLSATDQNDRPDKLTIDGDGNYTMSMKNTPAKAQFPGQQKSLESMSNMNSGQGGDVNFL